jgi:hypothetical protein
MNDEVDMTSGLVTLENRLSIYAMEIVSVENGRDRRSPPKGEHSAKDRAPPSRSLAPVLLAAAVWSATPLDSWDWGDSIIIIVLDFYLSTVSLLSSHPFSLYTQLAMLLALYNTSTL